VTLTSSDGQSVTVTPATLAWNNGVALATVTLNKPDSNPITLTATAGKVSGRSSSLVVESAASQAISNGLAALVSWAANLSFPLVDTATAIQDALQLGLIDPVNTYLSKNAFTGKGLLNVLQKLTAQIGNLSVTVAPGARQTTSGNQVVFSLDFEASETTAEPLQNLGAQAEQLGIALDPATQVDVTTSLNFNFSFGVDQTPGLTAAEAFFLNVPAGGLSASVAIDAANINSGITIGFLGAQTSNGSIQMSAGAANAASLSNLSLSGLQNLALSPSGSVNIVLPLQAQLGSQSASGTLTIGAANLATGAAPVVQFQGFTGWQNFTTIGSDAVLTMLNQLGSQLGEIGNELWTNDLPFLSSLSVAQAANLEQAFQTEVTNEISSWSDTLQRTVADFTTAQGLASLLAQALDVSPSSIDVQFNPTTNDLTYNLSFTSYTFSSLLSQTLEATLDQGGLANASVSGQLSLVPKITASLTFGVNLTPLGQGFVLTPSTPLSKLNGGAGVRINGSSPDLKITLTDGTSYQVSLKGAQTVQDVINDIETATQDKVSVTIDPSSQQALDLRQVTPTPSSGTSTYFTVASINNSFAAADLGIAGSDVEGIGLISGQSLSGDSLQKHVFIENATFQASVVGAASKLSGKADLGAVALVTANGTGSIHVQATLGLKNVTTLYQLAQALEGTTSLSGLTSSQVSGTANLKLPIQLAVPLPGFTMPSTAMVAVNWTNITNPGTLSVAVTPTLDLSNLTMQPVLQGLQDAETFIQGAAAALLSKQIPGLGTSLVNVVNPGALLGAAISNVNLAVPQTIDQLVGQLSTLLGQPVTVSFTNNVLQINLDYGFSAKEDANLGFKLSPTLYSIADANGSAPITLAVNGSVALGLVINLSQPATPQFSLQDSSKISVGALVDATGVSFNATVGPLGVFIENGTVRLDDGTAGQPATWTVGLKTSSANHLLPIAGAANQITSAITGQVNIVLPTFFPTPNQPLDSKTPNIELHVTNLANPGTLTPIVPNITSAMGSVSLNGIMDQAVDGWDGLMRSLESVLTGEIDAENIPVVGSQLKQALNFLQTIDQNVTSQLENDPQIAATTIQDALYDALGPKGLNWLAELTTTGATTEDDYVELTQTATSDHFEIQLQKSLASVSTSIAANLGLSGLGLSVNGDASLNAGFAATLGFGLSTTNGFYVDSTDTASVSFNAQLPSSATASLGFLQFNVSNNTPQTPQLSGSLTLGLNNLNPLTGTLSLANLASSSAYTVSMNAAANINLHLDATIAGDSNLPHMSTDFYFDWSANPTASDPDALGFKNVTFDMGGFIDGIANEIGQILAPIKPLAEVLNTPLPVLSQLSGQPFTLVNLAEDLGLCSQGTGEFIQEVLDFVAGDGLDVPTSVNLGSFTLNLSAAQNPASLGNLNPSPTTTNPYTSSPIPGFQIPILSNPASAFRLLLGQNVPLITYETPLLQLSFAFDEFFPIIGPLGADLAGEIGAQAQFGFGFDTTGFQQYAEDDFRDPSLILDGFYVSDRQNPDGTGPVVPQVELYGSIAAYAALDLGILQAGVGGGLFASIDFSVNDPSGTGLVHLQDLEADVQKGTIFDASGALQAFLNAYVEIDLGFISHKWTFDIASVTLATIGEPAPSTPPVPQLATQSGGDLRLNIGPYASQRLYGNTADGNETLTVTQVPGTTNSVYISGFGVTNQEYTNVTEITGEGAAGNDNITINVSSSINVNLAAGGGTSPGNTIDVQNAGNVTLTGGAGKDTLEVGNATSADIIGGSGNETLRVQGIKPATLQAGNGQDALYGGTGAGQLLYGGPGTNLLVAGSGANQVLDGGSGVSTLVGGTGTGQQLLGDTSTVTIFGGTGSGQVLNAGTGNAYLYAGEAAGQTLLGGSGDDVLQVGWALPGSNGMLENTANIAWNYLPIGAIDTTTGKPLQVGWHLQEQLVDSVWMVTNYTPGDFNQGAGNSYVMKAGTGNTLIIGGWGNDTIYGGSGTDTLYGGGEGNKVLYAGVGATQMYGGGPSDTLASKAVNLSSGGHTLFGGSGNDVLYGGDGVNLALTPSGTGLVAPGGDGTDDGVNILASGSGNSRLYSDSVSNSLGTNESTLMAGSGLDQLFAGGDNGDYLEAGSGVDSLYGGTGSDVFQLPFIPVGQQPATPDTMVGGYGLTSLVLKPVETEMVNDQLTQVSLTTDSDIYLNAVPSSTNQFLATLSNLDTGAVVGQVQFTMPSSVERIALLGGIGDNVIEVDPSVSLGVLLYGGVGRNILMAGSGNDVLVGGSGTSILEGGTGDDVLFGGAMPAVYQDLINNLGAGSSGPITIGSTTSDALMHWLRQQPVGHNVLIAGSGNSQLYAGNDGDLLIGGNAQWNAQTGQFVLVDTPSGSDVLVGGSGNDLLLAAPGSLGSKLIAGTGNDVLVGDNTGFNYMVGGPGNDLLLGGNMGNDMISGSVAATKTAPATSNILVGGAGIDFLLGAGGDDQLYASSNPAIWTEAEKTAAAYHVQISPPSNPFSGNKDTLLEDLGSEIKSLNDDIATLNEEGQTASNDPQVAALVNLDQQLSSENVNLLAYFGGTFLMDNLLGGTGTMSMYSGPNATAMTGTTGIDTFYITPANYSSFASKTDMIDAAKAGTDTLMFQADGTIGISYNRAANADVVTVKNASYNVSMSWPEGHNISTVGAQTMGGKDTVTIGSAGFGQPASPTAKLGSWTSGIRIVDGGVPGDPTLDGNVVINATVFTERATLLGGAGNDTIMIDNLASGSVVRGGTGYGQQNALDIIGESDAVQVREGKDTSGLEDLAIGNTWLSVANIQNLVVVGYSQSGSTSNPQTNVVQTDGILIPNVILEGGDGANVANDFTTYGGTNTLIGGGGVNDFTAYDGINTLIGGSGTNDLTASGGTSTITGGAGENSYHLTDGGTYGTSAGTYTVTGGPGENTLYVQCAASGDWIDLSQSGGQSSGPITVSGSIGGFAISATAKNMNSVNVYGSADGYDTLDASGMIMGVNLYSQGYGNTLIGGAGPDILDGAYDGGSNYYDYGFDDLEAGNNSDILYVSGEDSSYGESSSYTGTGDNTLVYAAQPTDSTVVVYSDGLLINGDVVSETGTGQNGYESGQPYTWFSTVPGSPAPWYFIPFSSLTGVSNVEIQDSGTGTTTARAATESDVPGYETFYVGSSETVYQTTWTITGSGGDNYSYPENSTWSWFSVDDTATMTISNVNNTSNYTYTWNYWDYASSWPNYPDGIDYTMSGTVGSGGLFGWFPSSGSINYTLTVTGDSGYVYWQNDFGYSPWYGEVQVGPGINVSNLTALATSANGAKVKFPQSFTTGGAAPQTSGLTYTIPNPKPNEPPISITSGYQFPIGTTLVTATATDGSGNTSTASFDVTVLPLKVSQDTTAIAVTTSSSAPVYGQPVTFTATVVNSSPGAGTPTGTMTFKDGTKTLGTGTLSTTDGLTTATFSTSNLALGSHSITAIYSGDTNDLTSTSSALSFKVSQDSTTTTVAAAPTATVYGQSVTFTATVAVSKPGAGTPTGTVTFKDGSTVLGTGTLSTTNGVTTATFSTTKLAVGSHSITAIYSGDTNDLTSQSTALMFNLSQDKTTTTIAAAPTATVYGQSVTFTATVAVSNPGVGTPSGQVTFKDGTTVLGTGALSTKNGVTTATFSTSKLALGSHSITAVYVGDTDDLTSTSAPLTLQVSQDATTTSVAATPTATVYGQSVTFKAIVAASEPGAGTPTGTVTFYDGSTSIATGTLSTSGGVTSATFTTITLALGSHSITAVYPGDTDDLTSTSAALTFKVSQDTMTTTVSAAPTASVYGQSVTFTATVAVSSPGAGTPTGTVTFKNGTTTLGTGTLSTTKGVTTATFSTSTLALGSYSITAVYAGDTDDLTSTSAALGFKVSQDTTTTTVAGSSTATVYGLSAIFTATVAVSSPGAGAPTGTVTFKDGTTTLGTGTLSTANGVTTATFSTTKLAVGSHSIAAVYSGDTNDLTSTSSAMTFKVSQDTTTTSVAAAPTGTVYGQLVTFAATVAISGPGAGTPTGQVTFKDGTTTLGTGTLSTANGVTTATFSTTKLAVGSHSITAVYAGDTNDLTSTSAALSFTVGESAGSDVQVARSTLPVVGTSSLFSVSPSVVDQAIDEFDAAGVSPQSTQVLGSTIPATVAGPTMVTDSSSPRKIHDLALSTLLLCEDQESSGTTSGD
jgi:Ca2+-binding RTX toxin-like protein